MRKNIKKTQFLPLPVIVIGTYGKDKVANAMTAAWATMYDTNQILIVIDKSHKTAKNLVVNKALTVSFATKETLKIADYVGMVSGNDQPDKTKKLASIKAKNVNAPIFTAFPVTLECKLVSYKDEIAIAKVVSMNVDSKYLREGNKIDFEKLNPLTYDMTTSNYRTIGSKVAKAFTTKKI